MTFPTSRRCLIGFLSGLAGLLLVPASAGAAPSSAAVAPDGNLDVLASGGDATAHAINVSYSGGSYLIADSAGITPGSGCAVVDSTSVSCADANVQGVVVQAGAGNDKISIASLGPAAAASTSFSSATGLFGGGGNDTIVGSSLRDLIRGQDGDDTIDGGLGPDNMNGQRGKDTVTYAVRPASQPVFVKMEDDPESFSNPDGALGGGEGDNVEAENVIGTPGNDTIIGFREGVIIQESSAANTFKGGAGNDTLIGLAGADKLLGEAGNDKLSGGPQKDKLIGGAGRDRCSGGKSKDTAKKCERKSGIP
jgi:Ca2+-binding RTX toxin-like protein